METNGILTTGSPHGVFTTGNDLPDNSFSGRQHIIFGWGNLWKYDLSSSVKRRLSTDSDELNKASDIVRSLSGSPTSFSATELLIVTWLDVAYPKKFSMEVRKIFDRIMYH